jgi:hypothetical protein
LAAYLKPLPARLNLIAYNPRSESPFAAPDAGDLDRFKDWLVEERLFVRKRTARGQSIMAACGQLGGTDAPGIDRPPNEPETPNQPVNPTTPGAAILLAKKRGDELE